MCCGSAGVAGFFLDLDRALGDNTPADDEYRAFIGRLTADLLQRATRDDSGMRWIQAEHRVRPDLLQAQTGFMQGAAGIGIELLHLHAMQTQGAWTLHFPDSPF